jgi:hypothetical protein
MHCWKMKRRQQAHLGSMERKCDVTMSAGGEVAPNRGNGGNDVNWAGVNLTRPKKKKIDTVDSAGKNRR